MTTIELPDNPFGDLDALCEAKREEYRTAQPFPHCVIDNLFPDELLEKVVAEFPSNDSGGWKKTEREAKSVRKQTSSPDDDRGPYTRYLFSLLGSPRFLRFVEQLTGVHGLVIDPYHHGGGLHEIASGGLLELHTDFNWNGHVRLYRRLNLLLYLNRDWKDEYEGALELWDRELTKGVKYPPTWNRLVIQHVTASAFHGLPEPIRCPAHMTRKSLAAWFYTADLPLGVQLGYDLCEPDFIQRTDRPRPLRRPLWRRLLPPVVTSMLKTQHQTRSFSKQEFQSILTRFVPPILIEAYQRLRGRQV